MDISKEKAAAIALAIHAYLTETVHDKESYKLTISPAATPWSSKALTLRKTPRK